MTASHPLDPLTGEEYAEVRRVLGKAGRLGPTVRFPVIVLDEPDKEYVLAFQGGAQGGAVDRRARATVLDTATGASAEVVVSLTESRIFSWRDLDPTADGQPPVLSEEYERCDRIVKADPGWREAMAQRGFAFGDVGQRDDLGLVVVCPLSAGWFGEPGERGRRMLRSLTFLRCHEGDSPWAHPVEGLLADVDLTAGQVVGLLDTGIVPVPAECGNYDAAAVGHARTSLRPLEITQPRGPSFTLDGHELAWEGWRLRLGFDAREGLVLRQLSFRDGSGDDQRDRPVLYRASIAEMVVPYADPDPTRRWISHFDAGEHLLGRNVNTLRLGCDCVGEVRYLDAVLHDDFGNPYTVNNAICLHEEDHGLLWKHTDIFTGGVETRRSRRMVISFTATVGNHDYAFYWHLYLDGTIGFQVKVTGVLFTAGQKTVSDVEAAAVASPSPYATDVAPGLLAPYHQHLFCARLDMTVDGLANTVEEVDVVPIPTGPENPYGNTFTAKATPIRHHGESGRLADSSQGRHWRITNPGSRNRLGQPVAYTLVPQPGPTLLAQPESTLAARAAFATRHLWVTRYDPTQRYPAGERPNQHPGGAGLPAWISGEDAETPLENTDVVLWHVFGLTHLPRTEEWPVMPVDTAGFTLRPTGFFDRNPALDVPVTLDVPVASEGGDCHRDLTPGAPGNDDLASRR